MTEIESKRNETFFCIFFKIVYKQTLFVFFINNTYFTHIFVMEKHVWKEFIPEQTYDAMDRMSENQYRMSGNQ